jgi:hypothetical protein
MLARFDGPGALLRGRSCRARGSIGGFSCWICRGNPLWRRFVRLVGSCSPFEVSNAKPTVHNPHFPALYRRLTPLPTILTWPLYAFGHLRRMRNRAPSSCSLLRKTHRGRKNGFSPLPRLYRASREAPALPHTLDMVHDGDSGVSSKHEVAVHAVHGEARGYGALCGAKALRDYATTVYTARTDGAPEWTRIGEYVLC